VYCYRDFDFLLSMRDRPEGQSPEASCSDIPSGKDRLKFLPFMEVNLSSLRVNLSITPLFHEYPNYTSTGKVIIACCFFKSKYLLSTGITSVPHLIYSR
jgi:hypothetical protein